MLVTPAPGAVAGMDPLVFWGVLAALTAGSLLLLRQGALAFWRLRTISDTPTARIQSAAQGYVELAGLARPHLGQVKGPLTDLPCLWYRYRIEKRSSGRNREWIRIDGGESTGPFVLDDGSGQCLLEPTGATLLLLRQDRWTGPHRNPRAPGTTSWFQASDRFRFTEERIADGDPLYCLGRFETPLRGVADRERLQRALLKVWKQDPARLARFDTNGDGDLGLDEWERARTQAGALAERAELERSRLPVLPRLKATDDPRQPFVIAGQTEEDITTTLRWQVLGLTLAFLVLAVITAAVGLARLGGG
ncbi:MAG TPA: hypothetical protein VES73_17855 [Lamprocystis sp. (in: g-proteobacteria)]|nr:hypothetical protein [Lamprocystis sp. (in: g-proteobacteria)]